MTMKMYCSESKVHQNYTHVNYLSKLELITFRHCYF